MPQKQEGEILTVGSLNSGYIYADVVIGGSVLKFLVDSGACTSILNSKALQDIKGLEVELQDSEVRLRGVTGALLSISGATPAIKMTIGDTTFNHEFLVVANIKEQGVLGCDFLKRYKACINYDDMTLSYDEGFTKLDHDRGTVEKLKVVLISTVELAPGRETVGPCMVETEEASISSVNGWYDYTTAEYWQEQITKPVYVENGILNITFVSSDDDYILEAKKGLVVGTLVPIIYSANAILDERREYTQDEREVEVLRRLMIEKNESLSKDEKCVLTALVREFSDVFALTIMDLTTPTDLVVHRIPLTSNVPVQCRYRNPPVHLLPKVMKEVQDLLQAGIIEISESPYSSPAVIFERKGRFRILSDFRILNTVSERSYAPVPDLQTISSQLHGSKYFSNLDMKSSFHQVAIAPEDRYKTATSIPGVGHYNFCRMALGLKGSPATMTSLVDQLARSIDKLHAFVDDLLITSVTFEEHMEILRKLFCKLRRHYLKLNPDKCVISKPKVKFLGRIFSAEGVSADEEKTAAILNIKEPTTRKEMLQFLGCANWLRSMIPDFAEIALGMYDTLKHKKFVFSEEARESFHRMKKALVAPELLIYPNLQQDLTLITDASTKAIGAVLCHINGTERHPVCYGSRVLSPAQRNYPVWRLELYALKTFMQAYRHYLIGREFQVFVDSKSMTFDLTTFMNKTTCAAVLRWVLSMSEFSFQIHYKPGDSEDMAVPDALSRLPTDSNEFFMFWQNTISKSKEMTTNEVIAVIREEHMGGHEVGSGTWENPHPPACDGMNTMKGLQTSDDVISQVYNWLDTADKPDRVEAKNLNINLRIYYNHYESLALAGENNLVCFKYMAKTGKYRYLICLPENEWDHMLQLCHDLPGSGHVGEIKTLERIRQKFWFPNVTKVTKLYVAACEPCFFVNLSYKKKNHGALLPFAGSYPSHIVSMDAAGPLTRQGEFKHILIIIDKFSKLSNCIAIPNLEAETIAEVFLNNWCYLYGFPEIVCSDQAKSFCVAKVMKIVYKLCNIEKRQSSPYHPQGNGAAEAMVKLYKYALKKLVQDKPKEWVEALPGIVFAFNTSYNTTTKFTPAEIHFGNELRLPRDMYYGTRSSEFYRDGAHKLYARYYDMKRCFDIARENVLTAQARQRLAYESRERGLGFKVGDRCVVIRPVPKKVKEFRSFYRKWTGPFTVTRQTGQNNYEIQHERTGHKSVVHFDHMQLVPEHLRPRRTEAVPRMNLNTTAAAGEKHDATLEPSSPPEHGPEFEEDSDDEFFFLPQDEEDETPALGLRYRHGVQQNAQDGVQNDGQGYSGALQDETVQGKRQAGIKTRLLPQNTILDTIQEDYDMSNERTKQEDDDSMIDYHEAMRMADRDLLLEDEEQMTHDLLLEDEEQRIPKTTPVKKSKASRNFMKKILRSPVFTRSKKGRNDDKQ